MKIFFKSPIYCLFFLIASHAHAQLTVFNVSSSDITDKGKISVQQQFEISDEVESSTTATFGLGRKWEAGLNLINLDYSVKNRQLEINDTTTAIPFAPLLLANAQKVFDLNEILGIGIGAVAGTNLGHPHKSSLVYYGYSNLVVSAGNDQRYQFATGPYISNHRYLSDGPVFGVQAAMDAGIWHKKLHLLADWISGSHQKGKLSVGLEVFLTQNLPLAFGWQRGNVDGAQAAVLQISFIPK